MFPADITGYPIYSGYDIDRLFHYYLAAVLLIPPFVFFLVGRKRADFFPARLLYERPDHRLFFAYVFPLLLFILHAKIPGTLSSINLFHDGESLAPALLSQKGFFPWRDFIVARGWIQDVGIALLGFRLFENSYWGFVAGVQAFWYPATLVTFYYLHRFLFAADWRYLLIAAALPFVIPDFFHFPYPRFILLPLVLLAFAAFLKKGSHGRAALLTLLLFGQAVLNPESSYLVLGIGIALLSRDLFERDFRRSLTAVVYSGFWLTIWLSFLYTKGAVDGFLHYYLHYVSGHAYGSGIPISPDGNPWFYVALALPFVLHGFLTLYWVPLLRKKRRADIVDWVVLALHLFNILYFRKFLSRADTHIWQVHAMNLPVFLWVLYRVSLRISHGIWLKYTAVAACCVLVFRIAFIRENLFPHSLQKSSVEKMGYFAAAPKMLAALKNLDEAIAEKSDPLSRLFDFSNEPALFFYLLNRRPSTPYYEVSLAVREKTQDYVVDRLKADPPRVVVYHGAPGAGVWNDPIPNSVRHWKLSRYLLENFSPYIFTSEHLLLLRNDLHKRPIDRDLYFTAPFCDWGLIPHYWNHEPLEKTSPVTYVTEKGDKFWRTKLTGKFEGTSYLELELSETSDDNFVISDQSKAEESLERVIFFSSKAGGKRIYRLPVAACPQWWGYRATTLYLYSGNRPSIREIRTQ